MKIFTSMLLTLFFFSLGNAQVSVIQIDTGAYQYVSQLQQSNLHFYIFGDGYHSFESSPSHYYDPLYTPNEANVFTGDPYNPDSPDSLMLHIINVGSPNPIVPYYNTNNKVELTESWNLVNNRENYYVLMFQNTERPSPIDGCIEFHFKDTDTGVVGNNIKNYSNRGWSQGQTLLASDYPNDYTHKFKWTFSNLEYQEQRFIYIPASCFAAPIDIVKTRAVMKVKDCNYTFPGESTPDGSQPGINNSPFYTLSLRVSNNPHDPNAIIADPGCLSNDDILYTTRYKIYFQNDGEIVEDVLVKYLFDAPIVNIKLVDASHSCVLTWTVPQNELSIPEPLLINFENILLPGLNDDPSPQYDETYAWFEIDVCYDLKAFTFLNLDCVNTEAAIYFENEPAVYAYNELCRNGIPTPVNTALNCQFTQYSCPQEIKTTQELDIEQQNKNLQITSINVNNILNPTVSPNPTYNKLIFENMDFDNTKNLKIYNSSSQLMRVVNPSHLKKNRTLDVSELESGIYYIVIQEDKALKTIKFVKL